jgi:enamine deaminase RidA (YjgF/YER057c/UK114 family)
MKNQVLRQVLHVKSISDWAPLCIGPYAQCNSLYDHTVSFVAGQIPLNPSSMSLREHCSQDEIAISNVTEACVELQLDLILSARHIAHVLNTQHSNLQCCLTLIVYLNTNHHWNGIISNEYWLSHLKPIIEKMAKSKYCCDNKDDSLSSTCRSDNLFYDDLLNEEQEEWDNDSLQDQQVGPTEGSPVIIFVGVPGLPRNAALEIEGVALKNGVVSNDGHKWSHVNKVIPSINDTCISGRLEFAFYPFCCGNGSILIATLDRSSIDFAQISWMLGSVILQSMHDRKVQLNISSLKCIRIFYLPEVLKDIDRFQSLFRQSLQNLGVTCFGLVCVPCCQLEKDAILNCVFQCMDFDQIETNRWISNV